MGTTPPPLRPPGLRALSCTNCGAPLELRAQGFSKIIVCGHCQATLDATDDAYQVIGGGRNTLRPENYIPLGARGRFRGEPYEVIGFMQRSDASGVYTWGEYLLYNPFKGFRWLVENRGHWTLLATTKHIPSPTYDGGIRHLGMRFKRFQSGPAKVRYVLGEFYWRVKVGDTTHAEDYIHPPYLLSSDSSPNEKVWTLGEYMTGEAVKAAFKADAKHKVSPRFPSPVGIAPNQPSPTKSKASLLMPMFGFFLFVAISIQAISAFTQRNKSIHVQNYKWEGKSGAPPIVIPLQVDGSHGNVVAEISADITNAWLSFDMTLTNELTGEREAAYTEAGYWTGRDSEGTWSEGSRDASVVFPKVRRGQYSLTIDVDGDGSAFGRHFSVMVSRDQLQWQAFWFTLVMLAVVPGFYWLRHASFETQRWKESDMA